MYDYVLNVSHLEKSKAYFNFCIADKPEWTEIEILNFEKNWEIEKESYTGWKFIILDWVSFS